MPIQNFHEDFLGHKIEACNVQQGGLYILRFNVDCHKWEFVPYGEVIGEQTLLFDCTTGDLSITENGPLSPIVSTVNLSLLLTDAALIAIITDPLNWNNGTYIGPTTPTACIGQFYYDSATGIQYQYNGTIWYQFNTAAGSDLVYIANVPVSGSMPPSNVADYNISTNLWTTPNSIYQSRGLYLPTIGTETNCVALYGLIDAIDAAALGLGTNYGVYYVDDMFNLTQTETDVYIGEYLPDGTFLLNIQVEHGRILGPTITPVPAINFGKFELRGDIFTDNTEYTTISRTAGTQHIVAGNTTVETGVRTGIFMGYDSSTAQPFTTYNKFYVNNGAYDFSVVKGLWNNSRHYFCGITNETGVNQPYVGYHTPLNNATPTFTYNIFEGIMDYVSGITVDTGTGNIIVIGGLGNDGVVLLVDSNLTYIRHRVFTANPGGYIWLASGACHAGASRLCVVGQEDDYAIAIEMVIDLSSVTNKATNDQLNSYWNTVEFGYYAGWGGSVFIVGGQGASQNPLISRLQSGGLAPLLTYELVSGLGYTGEITDIAMGSLPQLYFSGTVRDMFFNQSGMLGQMGWGVPSHYRFGVTTGQVGLNAVTYDGKQVFVGKAPKQPTGFPFPSPGYDDGLFMPVQIPSSITSDIYVNLPGINNFTLYNTDPVNEVWNAIIMTHTLSMPTSSLGAAPTVTAGTLTLTAVSATHEDALEVLENPAVTAPAKDGGPHREFSGAPTSDNDDVDTAGIGWKFSPGYIWLDINTFPATPYICLDSTPTAAVRSEMMVGGGNTDISCSVYASGTQSIGTTLTAVAFDTELFDTDTMHSTSTNNTRITFTTAGKYCVGGRVTTDGNATGQAGIRLNGSTYLGKVAIGNAGVNVANGAQIVLIDTFTAGEYVELMGWFGTTQNTKSGRDGVSFWAYKIG